MIYHHHPHDEVHVPWTILNYTQIICMCQILPNIDNIRSCLLLVNLYVQLDSKKRYLKNNLPCSLMLTAAISVELNVETIMLQF